jgi:parvulin-like peptidyl-prolyl isomerase
MKQLLILLISLAACLSANDKLATVDGKAVTLSQLATSLAMSGINYNTLSEKDKKDILDQHIDRILVERVALKSDIVTTPDFIDQVEIFKADLAFRLWAKREFDAIRVDEKEIKAHYDANPAAFQQAKQYKARHILVETKEEAEKLIQEINAAKEKLQTFITIAKEKSIGPSGANGGDLGWFDADNMVPEFAQAVRALTKESFSTAPVQTQFGFHILYLHDTQEPKTKAFGFVKQQIEEDLKADRFKKKIEKLATDLRKKSKINYTK